MSSSMNDFLNTVLQMRHVMNESQQVQQEGDRQKVAALTSFIQQAQMSQDPQLMTPLIDTYANAGVASRDDLLGILRTIAPTVPALQGYETKQGAMARNGLPNDQQTPAGQTLAAETANTQLTGMGAGQMAGSQLLATLIPQGKTDQNMADQAASRAATGMSLGQSGVDTALSQLPGYQQTQMAQIQGDLTLGARADAQNKLGWAQNRLGWANLYDQSAMNQAELNAKKAAARRPGAQELTGITQMLDNKGSLIKALTTSKEAPPPQVLMGYIGTLNAINQSLDALGIANEGQIPFDPALMADPSAYQALIRRLGGMPTGTGGGSQLSQPPVRQRGDSLPRRTVGQGRQF